MTAPADQRCKAVAWEAFQAGVKNGGDSVPGDSDYAAIQESSRRAFEAWWEQRRSVR